MDGVELVSMLVNKVLTIQVKRLTLPRIGLEIVRWKQFGGARLDAGGQIRRKNYDHIGARARLGEHSLHTSR